MKKIVLIALAVLTLALPAAALAKTDACPNAVCHPYDPADPCYMASACTTCGGCSACCGHYNVPYKEFDCSQCFDPCPSVTPSAPPTPSVPARPQTPVQKVEMPKTGAADLTAIAAVVMSIGAAVLPKKRSK